MTLPSWCRIGVVMCALVFALIGPVRAAPSPEAPGGTVSGSVEDGLGRLRFEWDRPVEFGATLENGRLVIRFGQPLSLDFAAATRTLGRYIGPPQRSADGRSVAVPLKRPVTLVVYDIDGVGFVDLLERTAEAETPVPAAPREDRDPSADDRAKERVGPTIGVRVGEHGQFSRIVFDWRTRVPYTVERSGDTVQVTFERRADVDVERLKTPPARHIRRATADSDDGAARVSLSVPADARVEDLRVGTKVVLDVYARGTRKPPASPPSSPPPGPPAGASQVETDQAGDNSAAEPAEAETTPPAPQPAEPHAPTLPETPPELEPKTSLAPPEPSLPANAEVPAENEVVHEGRAEAAAKPAGQRITGAPATLRFAFKEPTPAAVFMRAGHIWVVFASTQAPDLDAVREGAGSAIASIEQLPADTATVLRMAPADGIVPARVGRDGPDWMLEMGRETEMPDAPLDPRVQPGSPDGGAITVAAAEPADPVVVADPEVGDRLIVVPLYAVGHGLAHTYEFPELDLLASSQGLAIVPRIDDLTVSIDGDGVEITSRHGLHLSPVPDDVRNRSHLAPGGSLTRLTALDRWRDVPLQSLGAEQRRLLRAAANAEGGEREQPRMALAEFYLATGRAAESLGVLDVVAEDRPDVNDDARFRLLRSAAQVMMGRLAEAEGSLAQPQLAGNDEAALWQAALASAMGHGSARHPAAAPDLQDSGEIALTYPRELRTPLLFLLAEAAIDRGETSLARRFLDVLAMEDLGSRGEGRQRYLEGRLAQASGDFPRAIAHWSEAEQGAHRASRARAAVARIELSLDQGGMTPEDALRELEKLRFAWRGDGFELAYLRRMAALYETTGDDAASLHILRQALSSFPEHPEAVEITRHMAATFERLFLDGAARDMAPLSAIALFNGFRELTPAGDKGDRIIQGLADRLVAVDLLDAAADLLDDQVRQRLPDGVDRARVGARLALLRLLDRQPEAALDALRASTARDLPDALQRQRTHLRARALAELDRPDEALALLGDDDSIDADLIRADIHWRTKDWRNAGRVLDHMAAAAGVHPAMPLDDVQARHILNQAVAWSLADDPEQLRRLDHDYGAAMDSSLYRAAFRVVVPDDRRPAGLQAAVSESIAGARDFQAFLGAYRDRLQHQGLSALN